MKLKVILPTRTVYDGPVTKVSAQGLEGAFTLLPLHIDYAAALVPGLLFFKTAAGEEIFMGVDEGVLIKCGPDVVVSTGSAILGDDLGFVQEQLQRDLQREDERERRASSALARLQADFMKQYLVSMEDEG